MLLYVWLLFSFKADHKAVRMVMPFSAQDGAILADYRNEAECSLIKAKNAKKLQMGSMQNVSRSGRPYTNIVHNVQSPALKQNRLPYIKISRICRHSRQSVVSNPPACRMVESRILYVGIRESMQMF